MWQCNAIVVGSTYPAGDDDGVGEVSEELAALSNGARHDGGGRRGEHELKIGRK